MSSFPDASLRPATGVPAYFGPWQRQDWSALLTDSPAVAVINPASGPGTTRHPGYVSLVRQMQRRGTTVLGYVPTNWLQRSESAILNDAHRYVGADSTGYGTDGILFDEIPVEEPALRVVKRLVRAVRATSSPASSPAIACNPGRAIPTSWDSLANVLWITFEGTGAQYLERFEATSNEAPANDKCGRSATPESRLDEWHLVHSVNVRQRRAVDRLLIENAPSLSYVTPDRLPNPWDVYHPQQTR